MLSWYSKCSPKLSRCSPNYNLNNSILTISGISRTAFRSVVRSHEYRFFFLKEQIKNVQIKQIRCTYERFILSINESLLLHHNNFERITSPSLLLQVPLYFQVYTCCGCRSQPPNMARPGFWMMPCLSCSKSILCSITGFIVKCLLQAKKLSQFDLQRDRNCRKKDVKRSVVRRVCCCVFFWAVPNKEVVDQKQFYDNHHFVNDLYFPIKINARKNIGLDSCMLKENSSLAL